MPIWLTQLHLTTSSEPHRSCSRTPQQLTNDDRGCGRVQQCADAQADCGCQGDVTLGVACLFGRASNHVKSDCGWAQHDRQSSIKNTESKADKTAHVCLCMVCSVCWAYRLIRLSLTVGKEHAGSRRDHSIHSKGQESIWLGVVGRVHLGGTCGRRGRDEEEKDTELHHAERPCLCKHGRSSAVHTKHVKHG